MAGWENDHCLVMTPTKFCHLKIGVVLILVSDDENAW